MNVFDVGLLPADQGNAAFASQASQSANLAIGYLLFFEQLVPGITIDLLDAYTFSHNMVTNAGTYGFTDTTTPCLTGDDQQCADPSQTLFWDGYHLTEPGQTQLAGVAETLIHP
jgi:phospholipase/lecithinase/hemolysin